MPSQLRDRDDNNLLSDNALFLIQCPAADAAAAAAAAAAAVIATSIHLFLLLEKRWSCIVRRTAMQNKQARI